jgi:putative addiction module CopG family antidote
MSYQLPPDLEAVVQKYVTSGGYASADDVLRGALAALSRQDQEVLAIQEGIEDMEANRVIGLREFDKEFRRRNDIPQDA